MPLEYSNKKQGVIRKLLETGAYPTEDEVDLLLGTSETGIVALLIDGDITRFTFDALAAKGLRHGDPIKLRTTYGVDLTLRTRDSGWQQVSGEIRKGNKVYINGNTLNLKK